MRALLVVLALAVASAYAQNPISCNSTAICIKSQGTGCNGNNDPFTFFFCASGTSCVSNTCVIRPKLSESCDNSGQGNSPPCFDPNWSISCGNNNKCVYRDIYGPGETCKPTDVNYENGGCLRDLSCDSTTKKCSSSAAGAQCNTNNIGDDVCAFGNYCDETTNVCTARKGAGSSCNENHECTSDLVCTNKGTGAFTCQAPFQGLANAGCFDNFDCAADLTCHNDKCTPKADDGQVCQQNTDVCFDGASCVCDTKSNNSTSVSETGTAVCVNDFAIDDGSLNTQSAINAFKSMQSCLQGKKCHDYWMVTEQLNLRRGPGQCIQSCLKSAFETGFEKRGNSFNKCVFGSAAGHVVPALFALLALLAALLF